MNLPQIEKEILDFWKENKIFQKLKEKEKKIKRKFIFFEGPPTANGLPHIGHFLTRAFKDIILRFYDLLGYNVFRRAGWDTHGLPVEVEIEKELKIKNKKEIENFGIEEFIQKCKESVWRYKKEWEIYTQRMGFWLEMENPYITYDPFYIETLWKIIKKWHQEKILVRDKRVIPYCPRCATSLSNHELNQPDAYRSVTDPSVYVRVPLKDKNEYFLFWTTTPWTVLANVGLALNENFDYGLFKKDSFYWVEYNLGKNIFSQEPIKKVKGKKLIGIEYLPPFDEILPNFKRKTYPASFVSQTEGTGFVHLAPAYGQEDFEVGKKYNLPIIEYIDDQGEFDFQNLSEIKNWQFLRKIEKLFFKEADKIIFEEIKNRGFLFDGSLTGTVHDYPHCWRCKKPLIYKLEQTWVVKVSKFKKQILQNNSKINWIPDFIKNGRMGEWLKEGKDWNFSRKRYWGTPLPIWICQKCGKEKVVDSIIELSQKAKNTYIFLRHGEALSNKKNILSSLPESFENHLTPRGEKTIKNLAKQFKKKFKIDIIVASPLLRTKQTAQIISQILNVPIEYDLRLQEVNFGELNGKKVELYHQFIEYDHLNQFYRAPQNGENLFQVAKRAYEVILDLEKKYEKKTILIVTHSDVIWSVMIYALALSPEKTAYNSKYHLQPGQFIKIKPFIVPLNEQKEIDLHRPVIDKIFFDCSCRGKMVRVSEVVDVWFDSGAMPFGEDLSLNPKHFPADYICEGIDQTRGWFYTLLVVGTLLHKKPPYKNVLVLGHVLDKEGKKMSKSLGNVVSPMEMMEKYGADVLRLYFYSLNSPWESKKFNENDLLEVSKFFDLLNNIFNFYELYGNSKKKKVVQYHLLDKWFEIRFKQLNFEVFNDLKKFKITEASRKIIEFLDDFSRWWLRLSRERFKQNYGPQLVFFKVFTNYLILLAPFCPFISEYFWQKIRKINKNLPLSVHLAKWPEVKKLKAEEKKILNDMQKAQEITSKILAGRKTLNIKTRQPLKKVIVIGKGLAKPFQEIILQETNFLTIEFLKQKPEPKPNYFEFENIILDTSLDEDLIKMGIIRDIKRAIQDLRKQAELKPQEKASVAILALETDFDLTKEKIIIPQTKIIFIKQEPNKFLKLKELTLTPKGKLILYLL